MPLWIRLQSFVELFQSFRHLGQIFAMDQEFSIPFRDSVTFIQHRRPLSRNKLNCYVSMSMLCFQVSKRIIYNLQPFTSCHEGSWPRKFCGSFPYKKTTEQKGYQKTYTNDHNLSAAIKIRKAAIAACCKANPATTLPAPLMQRPIPGSADCAKLPPPRPASRNALPNSNSAFPV